jgi:glycosyltransferase involved in cell wall biosynthesis
MSVRAVTHVSESAGRGGADISMRRLVAAQHAAGMDVRRLVAEGAEEPGLARLAPMRLRDRVPFHALNLAGLNFAGLTGRGRVLDHPFVTAANVVHLHTLHGGYFNYRWLPELARRKPLVWTLHDQWALTGHCAYSFECARWRTGCGACPHPETYPAVRRDATATEWRWKSAAIAAARPHLICPSQWLLDLASAHPVLSALPRHHIPYGLDTDTFRPHDRESARAELGLPHDRVLALFAAQSLDNPFKNARLLAAALLTLPAAEGPARPRLHGPRRSAGTGRDSRVSPGIRGVGGAQGPALFRG